MEYVGQIMKDVKTKRSARLKQVAENIVDFGVEASQSLD
jgi:hypothetical protein